MVGRFKLRANESMGGKVMSVLLLSARHVFSWNRVCSRHVRKPGWAA